MTPDRSRQDVPESQPAQPIALVDAPQAPQITNLLALQRSAGNGAVARMLGNPGGQANIHVQREPEAPAATPEEKVRHALGGGSGADVRKLDDAALATTTAVQRAGLVKILTDQLWTDQADERFTLRLITLKGEQAAVLAQLDVLGYRQKLVESIDDEVLNAELQTLLGVTAAGGTGPVAAALTSRDSADVLKIAIADIRAASRQQRIGLLQIMLAESSSDVAGEGRIVDILESSAGDLAATVADVKALGLKQRLFDHIDDDNAKMRLTTLLKPLGDAEIDADLVVFNRSFLGNLWEGVKQGASSAVGNFSIGNLVMGLLQPIIHPFDTILKLVDDTEQAIKEPSVDRVVTLLRDIMGTIGMWLLVASGLLAGVGLLLTAATVTAPAGVALGGVAGSVFTAASWCGVAFVVLAIVKTLLDGGEAGAATTAQEHQAESKQLGEDFTTLAVIGLLAALVRGVGSIIKRIRGTATDPVEADPESLRKQADEAKDSQQKATDDVNKLKDAADKKKATMAQIDPNAERIGDWKFETIESTEPDGTKVARIEVTSASGRGFGHAERGWNERTGEFQDRDVDLGQVPPEARFVEVAGEKMSLNDYLTMRIMRLLKVPAESIRTVRVQEVMHVRSVLQLEKAAPGEPVGEGNPKVDTAARDIDSVKYNERAMSEVGAGKVTKASVTGGKRMMLSELLEKWEGTEAPPDEMVKRHNNALDEAKLTREDAKTYSVRTGFDVVITIEPPASPTGPGAPTVVPVAPSAHDDRDGGTD